MTRLPIEEIVPDLIATLRSERAAVIQAPTGSGKTTRTPLALLEAGLLAEGQLLVLQPRRVAARACAATMARNLGEAVGETVGYQIRFDRKVSRKTKVQVITEGILTRRFQSDALLEGVAGVVLDEFHERSIHTDLALAFVTELRALREDLMVVVMSATLDAEPVARFLDCPVLTAGGRTFPLRIEHLDPGVNRPWTEQVRLGLRHLFDDAGDDDGDVLVFLPGAPEIRRVQRELGDDWGAEILPLHGSLTAAEQDRVFGRRSRRRIILATNIAETSLTIEGVSAVVDTGKRKALTHDPTRGVDRLDTVRISRASADQRAGRAGRTGPGRVVRLWSESLHLMLADHDPPEIATADLAPLALQVLDFHGPDLDAFPFFQPPPEAALDRALMTLRTLEAIDAERRLTDKGRRLNALPLHPRLASLLARAQQLGALELGARVGALLSEKPISRARDLTTQLDQQTAFDVGEIMDGVDPRAARQVRDTERQILRQARAIWGDQRGKAAKQALPIILLAGYADRLCQVRGEGLAVMVDGRGVAFEAQRGMAFFLALDLTEVGGNRTARQILPLDLDLLLRELPVQEHHEVVFDPDRQAVHGVRQTRFEQLILRRRPDPDVDPNDLATRLAEEAAKVELTTLFKADKNPLRERLQLAAKHLSEHPWPDATDEGLRALLPDLCQGCRSFDDLRKRDWLSVLTAQMPYQLKQTLDRELPERIQVPSGSHIAIDYAAAFTTTGHPVLAVRLQEVFGLAETPKLAKGRIAVLLHLLAPNMRPCQVTQDLANFWNTTYTEVRKELRQRYPKHHWPEDPWTAEAIRGAKRRR